MKILKKQINSRASKTLRYIFYLVIIALGINLIGSIFFLKKVKGISMSPTLPNDTYIIGITSTYINYLSVINNILDNNFFDATYHKKDIVLIEKRKPVTKKSYISRLFVKRIYSKSGDCLVLNNGKINFTESIPLTCTTKDLEIIQIPRKNDRLSKYDMDIYNDVFKIKENHLVPTLSDKGYVTITNDLYFVLGDNLEFSSDSRDWGLISEEAIVGKVILDF